MTSNQLTQLKKKFWALKSRIEKAEGEKGKLLKKHHRKETVYNKMVTHGRDIVNKIDTRIAKQEVDLATTRLLRETKAELHQKKGDVLFDELAVLYQKVQSQNNVILDLYSDLEELQAEISLLEVEEEAECD